LENNFYFFVMTSQTLQIDKSLTVKRITALWAFSEAALGGILHAFKVPFTGLFIGGFAVIFISLIAYYSGNPKEIVKATFIVMSVKFLASPHTPLTAYFSVMLQGLTGYVLFYKKTFFRLSAFALGTLTLLFSSLQKIIISTLLFGMTLWESVDLYYRFIIKQFAKTSTALSDVSFSLVLISAYTGLHLLAGMFLGIIAGKLPGWINDNHSELKLKLIDDNFNFNNSTRRKKRKFWWQKKSGIFLLFFLVQIVIISYFTPGAEKNFAVRIGLMLLRVTLILFVWLKFIAPLILKFLQKLLQKYNYKYSSDIDLIISLFPNLKKILISSYTYAKTEKGLLKVKYFFVYLFVILLVMDLHE